MVKQHLLRLAAPSTWPISRKLIRFVLRPRPGAHSFDSGIPISIILRNLLSIADTTKEVQYILNNKSILIDGKRVKDKNYQVGLMDVISIPDIKKNYRVLINKKNKIYLKEIDDNEAKYKICRIVGKIALKENKIQLNLHDAKNTISKEKCKVGDSVVFEFGKGITKKLEFKEGSIVYLISGKHVGEFGSLVKVIETKRRRDEIIIKSGNQEIRTAKRYAFVVGEDKPQISLD
jgi:small subunit ribosomal protein S4e